MTTPMNAARKEFLGRWIAYGTRLFNQAESYGIDWRAMPMEQLSGAVILAEEWAAPDEPRREFQNSFNPTTHP